MKQATSRTGLIYHLQQRPPGVRQDPPATFAYDTAISATLEEPVKL
jgi:hypothetical protein